MRGWREWLWLWRESEDWRIDLGGFFGRRGGFCREEEANDCMVGMMLIKSNDHDGDDCSYENISSGGMVIAESIC